MAVHVLIHTSGVTLGSQYFPLELAYGDVTGYQLTVQIKSPIPYKTRLEAFPHAHPDAIMSAYKGFSEEQWIRFLQNRYTSLQTELATPDIGFGCKGAHQMAVLQRAQIPRIVDVETVGCPSLDTLKERFGSQRPRCPWHVAPTDKCARFAVHLMTTHFTQQQPVLPLGQP